MINENDFLSSSEVLMKIPFGFTGNKGWFDDGGRDGESEYFCVMSVVPHSMSIS